MSLIETFQMAVQNILSSKMRTFLTMLGIIIGVCAVIVIVGLGNGMQGYIEDSFADMGTDSLTVMVMGRGSSRSVSEGEMYQLVADNSDVFKQISPTVTMSGSVKIGSSTLSATSVTGVSEDYFSMKGYEVAQGRGLQYTDMTGRKKVCIVGQYLNQVYYGGNAVGQTLRINGNSFTIVGVMGMEGTELEEGGTDDCVFLPYSTAARLSFTGTISSYTITVQDTDQISQAKTTLENALYEIFEDDDAYTVGSMAEMVEEMNSMVNMVIYILAGIAAISLVVGGIGIMNIMLVSVTERTREIGIRKALGAREGAIMRQFVIEAATTSSLGGVLGIALGFGLSAAATVVIANVMPDTPITVSPSIAAILVAFGVSAGIGIAFGYLPAKKAAVLNPGTPDAEKFRACRICAVSARHPVVLDPVGVGASPWRLGQVRALLDLFTPSILRVNLGEARALLGSDGQEQGVDSPLPASREARRDTAMDLARRRGTAVLLSGPEDLITDGARVWCVTGGSGRMSLVTGTGCMLSVLCGVFAAVEPDAAAAAALASAFWKICARRAEHLAADRGSGSFRTALLDAANTLTASDAAREAEILTL